MKNHGFSRFPKDPWEIWCESHPPPQDVCTPIRVHGSRAPTGGGSGAAPRGEPRARRGRPVRDVVHRLQHRVRDAPALNNRRLAVVVQRVEPAPVQR